jgi:hypothetical protein
MMMNTNKNIFTPTSKGIKMFDETWEMFGV